MKNIIITILLGIIGVTAVSAYTNPLSITDTLELPKSTFGVVNAGSIVKVYDVNNNTTCYLFSDSSTDGFGGISCVK